MADRGRGVPLSIESNLEAGTCVRVGGSRFEMGQQHGQAHQSRIHRFLKDRRARLEALVPNAVKFQAIPAETGRYIEVIESRLPAMAEEVHGLAQGADISIEDAYLLQLRRELVGYQSVRPSGDCTTFGRLAGASTVLGQTIDLNGNMQTELTVMDINHQRTGRRLVMASFTGLLGYLGMNSAGLAVGLNLVLGGGWRPGIPGYMVIRHLLDEASSVDECLALLRELPLASSRSLTITDGQRLVVVEYILDELRVTESELSVHTNHFLHPDFVSRDELNPFARTSSLRRLDACAKALPTVAPDAPASAYFSFLHTAPVYVEPNGEVRRECTVGAVVMHPQAGAFAVRQRDTGLHPEQIVPRALLTV